MPARFNTPFPEFHDENGNPREGYKLFFFANGTTTKLATYNDVGLSVANLNPMTLDEYGRIPDTVFLQNEYYTVVLGTPDSDDTAPTGAQIVWQDDYVSASDFKSFSIRKVYNGNPNGFVAGTAGSSGVLPTECWDYTNSVLYVCTTTGNAAAAVWTALNAAAAAAPLTAQGRLTLTSNTPYLATGVTSGTAVYYTPATGNIVPIYGGASFTGYTFTQLTLTLSSSHLLNTLYDVFIFIDGSTVTIGTGPAWSTLTAGSGARGTGAGTTELTRVLGFYVNANSITLRNGSTTYSVAANRAFYVGTIYIDGTAGQITCHTAYGQSRKWGVWNAFNRKRISLLVGDSTTSWNPTALGILNGNTANKGTILCGLPEEDMYCRYHQKLMTTFGGNSFADGPRNGIGVNSTSTASGVQGDVGGIRATGATQVTNTGTAVAEHIVRAAIGLQDISLLAQAGDSGTSTAYGGIEDCCALIQWDG